MTADGDNVEILRSIFGLTGKSSQMISFFDNICNFTVCWWFSVE